MVKRKASVYKKIGGREAPIFSRTPGSRLKNEFFPLPERERAGERVAVDEGGLPPLLQLKQTPIRVTHKKRRQPVPPPAVWDSDANLALHLLNDAWLSAYDCAVIVSNDSDMAESLRLVKEQHQKLIGLVTPSASHRKTSQQLRKYADFVKPIRTWALKASQLPNPIPGTNIHKPVSW